MGLKRGVSHKRQSSLAEQDDEPRYEISKLQGLAKQDLDLTINDNQSEADRFYGNGMIIGKEIDDRIKQTEIDERDRLTKKQLESSRLTFQKFVKERESMEM